MTGFNTKSIHSEDNDGHHSLRFPVYDSVAFGYESSRDIQLAFEGRKPAHSYSRISNPTVENFEQKIRSLSGGTGVVAVSSGMAAISNLILALGESGTNIITSKHLFGNTLSLFEKTLKPWGLETRYADFDNPESISDLADSNTRGVFGEIITNPQMSVPDIRKIADISHKHSVPLIVDTTVTTPYIFKSRDFGVDIEVLSSTKYISGGATSVGGLIIDNGTYDWKKNPKLSDNAKKFGKFALLAKLKNDVFRNLGACMSPQNAYYQTLGLETIGMRIDRSCANALAVAGYLDKKPEIKKVNYPGLTDSRYYQTASRQFGKNFGGVLTFQLESKEQCFTLMDTLKLINRATNLNDNKTLILHPASTIFCEYSEEERRQMKVSDNLLRLSVGIEDIEDIISDLNRGITAL